MEETIDISDLKPIISKRAFWDIDMDKMDYHAKSDFIIRRVFERGTLDDIIEVLVFYGRKHVKEALVNAHYLPMDTMMLACTVLNLQLNDFLCYTTKRFLQNY